MCVGVRHSIDVGAVQHNEPKRLILGAAGLLGPSAESRCRRAHLVKNQVGHEADGGSCRDDVFAVAKGYSDEAAMQDFGIGRRVEGDVTNAATPVDADRA